MIIQLKTAPELKRVITAAFPGYKKHRAHLAVFTPGQTINSYWDGGSRAIYAVVDLATLRAVALPTASHPYFDVARRGLTSTETEWVSVDHVGTVTLKGLPDGFALVETGTFCGKPATACVYVPAANMPRYIEEEHTR